MSDFTSCKISNSHILAMDHPIHFMFGSRVGFSESVDRMAPLAVLENYRNWKNIGDNNARGVIRSVTV